MKHLILKLVAIHYLLLVSFSAISQNQQPELSNINAVVDWSQQLINITYDVSDAESDPLEITFKVSNDSGKSFFYSTAITTGDIGYPISPGNGKSILWDYNDTVKDFSGYVFLIEANDRKPVNIQDIVNQVDSGRLYDNVTFMEGLRHRNTGAANLQNTRDSLFQRFDRYDLLPWVQNFSFGLYTGQNIIGKLPGMVHEDTVYIIDAHYDGVAGGPAADDNASGTAGVLEAARILSQFSFEKSIRFIGFDLEEDGLKGSIAYVNSGVQAQENIDGVLNFEMIGYYSNQPNSQTVPSGFNLLFPTAYTQLQADTFKGNFISTIGNTASDPLNSLFKNSAQLYVPQLRVMDLSVPGKGTIAPDFRRSDHAPFWDTNRKALMLTDGANFRNKNYHSANDVKDSLNFGFMTNVVKATIATVATLAVPRHSDVQVFRAANPVDLAEHIWDCDFYANYQKDSNSISLRFEGCQPTSISYALINEAGKNISQGKDLKAQSEMLITPGRKLPHGIYILQLTNTKGQSTTSKILVE